MKLTTQGAAVTALVAAAVAAATGAAQADSSAIASQSDWTSTELAPGIRYTDSTATGVAAIRTPVGSVALRAGQFDIRDTVGNTVLGTPIDLPEATAANTAATNGSPVSAATGEEMEPVAAQPQPVAGDLISDLNQAVAVAAPHMGLAMAVGAVGGSIVGAALGCPFGIATGGTLMSLATVGTMTVPAIAASCLVGAVAVGGLGASLGGVAVAIPVGIAAGTQKFNQLQAQRAQPGPEPHVQ
ncbi:hypothetical protein [Nocardia pseudovaccinii]|uniref:hypothetical protein n=1 Tax=Nocardia pseudovaccinii TaxID=189540 RepID=UPI0007A3EA73|nr:hypothetical protein [Nocardia pseudovaccinii]